MKSRLFLLTSIVLVGCSLNCGNPTQKKQVTKSPKTPEDLEKEKVLKMAEEIAFREYSNIVRSQLPLEAKLVGDSVWIIEGRLAKGADGGTVYIELSKSDTRLLKITHYK